MLFLKGGTQIGKTGGEKKIGPPGVEKGFHNCYRKLGQQAQMGRTQTEEGRITCHHCPSRGTHGKGGKIQEWLSQTDRVHGGCKGEQTQKKVRRGTQWYSVRREGELEGQVGRECHGERRLFQNELGTEKDVSKQRGTLFTCGGKEKKKVAQI